MRSMPMPMHAATEGLRVVDFPPNTVGFIVQGLRQERQRRQRPDYVAFIVDLAMDPQPWDGINEKFARKCQR